MMTVRVGVLLSSICIYELVGTAPSAAQEYPSKPIRFVVTSEAGTAVDLAARIITSKLKERLGWTTLVENRPGGGQIVGTLYAVQSPPDGYTVLHATSALTILPFSTKSLPFDLMKDLAPVTRTGTIDTVLVVNSSFPVGSLAELVAYSKSHSGKLNYAGGGTGTPLHLVGEQIKLLTGLDALHIPTKSGVQIVNYLLAGNVQFAMTAIGNVSAHIENDKLRPILLLQPRRNPLLPKVPSTADAGIPEVDNAAWFSLMFPSRTPRPIIDKLNRETVAILQLPDVQTQYLKMGLVTVPETPEQFRKQLETELVTWGRLIREAKITFQ